MKRQTAILILALAALAFTGPASAEAGSLKRSTAKGLFNKTAAISGPRDYLGCRRVTKFRFFCRAKWTYSWSSNSGSPVTDVWKAHGFVKRNGNWFKVKATMKHSATDSTGTYTDTQTNWKLYRFG